ncbi:hypothetical protein GPALN_003219 [Globodera pallida]|nr:hypothetical protein GPALN_003219 [Globodera pallida]
MQRRRELFGRQKTAKDNNEDSGLSRDLHSVESDSCPKSTQVDRLSEQLRRTMYIQSNKPPPLLPHPPTPTAPHWRPAFSLPRLFSQKKKDVAAATVIPPTGTVPIGPTTHTVPVVQDEPQLSPSTTTTTSAYNTGADTGQESPIEKGDGGGGTQKPSSDTVGRTNVDGRSTVAATALPPALPPAKHPARKQHVRFESDSASRLPQAMFYTSAERLAETVATQQRLLHQELSISESLMPQLQQKNKEAAQQQRWRNDAAVAAAPKQQQNKNALKQRVQIQQQQYQKDPPKQQTQYPSSNQQIQQLQYPTGSPKHQMKHSQVQAPYQQVQHAKAFQAGRQDVQQLNKQPKQQIQYQKGALGQQVQYASDLAMQQVHHQAPNPKGFLTIRQQAQHSQQPQYQQVPYQKQFLEIQYPVVERQQIQHSNRASCQRQQQYPSRLQYPGNKMPLLHKTERRLTAEDVLSIDEPIIRQHPPVQRGPAGRFTSSTSSQLPRRDRTQANFSLPISSGIGIRRLETSNSAQNLPRPDWPQCAELAELFAFRPMTATAVQHQQHREKRRGSPSKQISGQHRQQPELEWVIKRRPDGTRYVTRRPVRKRAMPSLLAAVKARREQSLARERAGMSTTDDDGGSEVTGTGAPKWWASRRKPPPIPSAFSPSSLARKKPPSGDVSLSDVQKAFTVTTV